MLSSVLPHLSFFHFINTPHITQEICDIRTTKEVDANLIFSDQHPLLFTYLSHWTVPRFLHIIKFLLLFLVVRTSCS